MMLYGTGRQVVCIFKDEEKSEEFQFLLFIHQTDNTSGIL